jgi:hypothetical protein
MSDNAANRRLNVNIRVDADKHTLIEQMRKTGFGLAQTSRNRSDVYNEVLGYGIQTQLLRKEIGDRDFIKLWNILHRVDWTRVNLEKIEKFFG